MPDTSADPTGESTPSASLLKAGQGHWPAFQAAGLDIPRVEEVAKGWTKALSGVSRPWLCWKVDDDWCLVQQRLVQSVGWTPVIGYDPRAGAPKKVIDGAIVIDFNDGLGLPILYPHFPLEFVFRFTDKLAFWHSDLLLPKEVMKQVATEFNNMKQGQTIATRPERGFSYMFTNRRKRYWELLGCTTRLASAKQFEAGCGWWRPFSQHPNCPNEQERLKRSHYHWDHGGGIYYWQKFFGGDVTPLTDRRIFEGHFTKIGNKNYKRQFALGENWRRLMSAELVNNFDLKAACAKVGLSDLL